MSVLLREAIGDSIRRARTGRRRTLRDVSREARVSLGHLSEVERGRKEPSSELLAAICGALSMSLPDLLDDAAAMLRPVPVHPVLDPALRCAVEEALAEGEGDDGARGSDGVPADATACAQEPVALASTVDDASDVRTDLLPGSVVLPAADLGAPEDVEDLAPGTVALVTRRLLAGGDRGERVARAA